MDEAALDRIANLGLSLRQSANLIFDKSAVLSLDAWSLFEIEEAFSLILEVEQYTNFHVLPPNHRQHYAIPHLQFVYDLLQKINKLRIWSKPGKPLPYEQIINLRCLRSLYSLELDNVKITQLKGLQNLRPALRTIIVRRACTAICEILLECGADKATEYRWDELQIAIFSHNDIGHLDSSLRLLSNIRVLDLSYCQLTNATALFCLPTITHLNLSCNKLVRLPDLSETAASSLVCLQMSSNLIINLRGLMMMPNIEELDLCDNLITMMFFQPLKYLSRLRRVNLCGNPVTCNVNYRLHMLRSFNVEVKYCNKFRLDGTPIEFEELREIGTLNEQTLLLGPECSKLWEKFNRGIDKFLHPRNLKKLSTKNEGLRVGISQVEVHPNCSSLQNLAISPIDASPYLDSPLVRGKSKKIRERHVSIVDPDDPENLVDPLLGISPTIQFAIEEQERFNSTHIEEAEQANTFNSTQFQSDKLLEEILHSTNFGMDQSSENPIAQFDGANISNYKTQLSDREAECRHNPENEETVLNYSACSSFYNTGGDKDYSRNSSKDYSLCSQSTSDQDEICLMFLARTSRCESVEDNFDEDVILSLSASSLKEKDSLTSSTIYSWPVSTLESFEVLTVDPYKVRIGITANEVPFKRLYLFEEMEFKNFEAMFNPILESNVLNTLNTMLKCMKCESEFSNFFLADYEVSSLRSCPNCFCSDVITLSAEDCLNNSKVKGSLRENGFSGHKTGTQNNLSKLKTKNGHQARSSASPSSRSDSSSSCQTLSSSTCRRESDVEVISNNSLSSIEIIQESNNEDSTSGSDIQVLAEVRQDVRTPPDSLALASTVAPNREMAMVESSSSGSMTGSASTTIDQNQSLPGTPIKAKGEGSLTNSSQYHFNLSAAPTSNEVSQHLSSSIKSTDTVCHVPLTKETADSSQNNVGDVIVDNLPKSPFVFSWIKAILLSLTGYQWEWWEDFTPTLINVPESLKSELPKLPHNPFVYNYENYSQVDHRLQLYAEFFLFKDLTEHLLGLIKGVIVLESGIPFTGLLILSDQRMYILEITGEEDDSPQEWLEEHLSHALSESRTIYSLYYRQGIGIKLDTTILLLCLADSERANYAHNFIIESLENNGVSPCIEELSPTQESSLTSILSLHHAYSDNIVLFVIATLLDDEKTATSQFFVLSEENLFMFEANLNWYHPRNVDEKLELTATESIMNIVGIDVYSSTSLTIQFQNEADSNEHQWHIHVPSSTACCHIIQAIRAPWTSLFAVDLQVTGHGGLGSVKKMLKEIL